MSLIHQTQGVTFKVLGIALLALLMLIPLAQVNTLIGEREGRAREATQQIASRWGSAQLVGGPVLAVPVRCERQREDKVVTLEEIAFLLPDRLGLNVTLTPELRSYGIYETVVYTAAIKAEGRFAATDFERVAGEGCRAQWARTELRVPVADVHGIRRASALRVGSGELAFGPDGAGIGDVSAITAAIALDPATMAQPLPFAFELTVAGSERFAALPLARATDVHVEGTWPDPGFDGTFVPAERHVDASGFRADWQVLDLNRRIPQHWSAHEASTVDLAASAFGVSLVRPANAYQQNVRAGKYGLLFVALTFVAFFLFEVLRGLRVHPVQYLLVGAALCTFYLVLLALSEQVGFGIAYAIAAAAIVLIVGGYAAAVLRQRRAGFALGGLLALVYVLLYGLVRSEDYALLMGSLGLLATLVALMALTRRVDWYVTGARASTN
ncbi:cell envelope integrity protein CreD [Dokdonella sp.]|uniref:cell envelope integrity protein CreD n=1 Tax=Dokdonella sp. TaxID=2291710 RepID=UPI003783AE60